MDHLARIEPLWGFGLQFLRDLADPDAAFSRNAVLMGLIGSLAFGMLGSLVVARRLTYLTDAVAHCVLGGVGLGLFLQFNFGWTWADPMLGGLAAALAAALGIGLVSLYARQREDTVISVVWVLGVAVGLLLIEGVRTPDGVPRPEPMAYLFGSDVLWVSNRDLMLLAWLDVLVVGLVLVFRNKLIAVCFDAEFAALRGVRANAFYLLLLCLTALTVVLMVQLVGILLVVALLTLPAAVAAHFARRLWQMMLWATLLCMAFVFAGLWLSYGLNSRSGPTIILVAGAVYLAVLAVRGLRKA